MTLPLSTPFPLEKTPFNSRVSSLLNSSPTKNYYAIAFNPGYPLQASELNELQELFSINSTLNARYPVEWTISGTSAVPFWQGLIPYNPSFVDITNVVLNNNRFTGDISISSGWYLWTEFDSKLSYWIFLENSVTGEFDISINSQSYVGFTVKDEIITCCSSTTCSDSQDAEIRDNSSGFPGSYLTCGASRLKATITEEIDFRDSIPTNADPDGKYWSLLFKIMTDDNTISADYINNNDNFIFTKIAVTEADS